MPVKRWNPSGVAPPVAFYSHLAEAQTGSRVVAMAGQFGCRLDGSIPESLEDQFDLALENILTLCKAAGADGGQVLKLIVFLTDPPTDRARIAAAMTRAFGETPPAMTWIYVKGLFRPEVKVEIDVTLATF
ncbi:MAG: RidA family protein [Caulobacteraceae bacterium]